MQAQRLHHLPPQWYHGEENPLTLIKSAFAVWIVA
jgi:hypothetical protein